MQMSRSVIILTGLHCSLTTTSAPRSCSHIRRAASLRVANGPHVITVACMTSLTIASRFFVLLAALGATLSVVLGAVLSAVLGAALRGVLRGLDVGSCALRRLAVTRGALAFLTLGSGRGPSSIKCSLTTDMTTSSNLWPDPAPGPALHTNF